MRADEILCAHHYVEHLLEHLRQAERATTKSLIRSVDAAIRRAHEAHREHLYPVLSRVEHGVERVEQDRQLYERVLRGVSGLARSPTLTNQHVNQWLEVEALATGWLHHLEEDVLPVFRASAPAQA